MKALSAAGLLACTYVGLVFAQQLPPPSQSRGTEEAIKQLERDWVKAEQAGDASAVAGFMADDWAGWGAAGNKETKPEKVDHIKSGAYKVQSIEIAPMDVKVLGDVAVCLGSDTEKSTFNGKDTSGRYVWTDVSVKRNGRWQAVRSHIAKAP